MAVRHKWDGGVICLHCGLIKRFNTFYRRVLYSMDPRKVGWSHGPPPKCVEITAFDKKVMAYIRRELHERV